MGEILSPKPVKLFIAVTYQHDAHYQEVLSQLKERFGNVEQLIKYDFTAFTDYYNSEMGNHLYKVIMSFETLISKEKTASLKHYSNEIESQSANKKEYPMKRAVNIDPGYLTEAKVILLTTKNFAHRIYIGNGIFAEITLTYRKNSYTFNNWTYPDYKSQKVISYFNDVRIKYREQIL